MENSTADLKQVSGTHYKSDYQHWTMLRVLGYGCEYYIGQATKYLSRWRKKNGLRDLAKARHFIEKTLEIVEDEGEGFLTYGGKVDIVVQDAASEHLDSHLRRYFKSNEIDDDTAIICVTIMFANGAQALRDAIIACEALERTELEREQVAGQPVADKEPPVSLEFKFLGYEGDYINWECSKCGEFMKLKLDNPPNYAHTHCVIERSQRYQEHG